MCKCLEFCNGRFRANAAEGALIAIFKELNEAFLSLILEILNGTSSWQDAEVCLYAAASISKEVVAAAKAQNQVAISFLNAVYTRLLGSSDETSMFLLPVLYLKLFKCCQDDLKPANLCILGLGHL